MAEHTAEHTIDHVIEEALNQHQAGKLEEAKRAYESLLVQEPEHSLGTHLLGMVHQQLGQLEEAFRLFQKALQLEPENPTYHFNMGLLEMERQNLKAAFNCFDAALKRQDDYADAWEQFGRVAEALGQTSIAKDAFTKLIELEPHNAQWYEALAILLEKMNRPDEAIVYWVDAAIRDPKNPETHFRVGKKQYEMGRLEEAVQMFRHVLSIQLDHTQASLYLAQALAGLGQAKEARSYFQLVYLRSLVAGIRLRRLFTLPVVYNSSDDVAVWQKSFQSELVELQTQKLAIENPVSEVGMTPFYLAYQGQDVRDWMEQIANVLKGSLSRTLSSPNVPRRSKPKIAVVSRHLHTPHTIQRIFRGIFEKINRDQFEILECPILNFGESSAPQAIHPDDQVTSLYVSDYWGACETLLQEAPDLIFYPDVGMEPMTYFLALQRLAPVQCVGWGHPVTTGMPHVDYYLSSRWFEPEQETAQHSYSEKLVLLEEIPAYFERTTLSDTPTTREEFGFNTNQTLYICPQSIYKFHPNFDSVFERILKEDPHGQLVIFEGEHPTWHKQLLERWKKSWEGSSGVFERVTVLPMVSREKFLRTLSVADVMLDTPVFGGGCTTLEGLSVGLPIVTLEGNLMRQRATAGILRRIGVTETIATSLDDYVTKALELGRNATQRQEMKDKILSHHAPLYENAEVVRQFETFFQEVLTPVPV